ncbi:MAG: V-type ATPase subunit [Gammaproteobacteria bacterium]|nr:V-type ATPase subunit [Gammaproteobacteria bacterium]
MNLSARHPYLNARISILAARLMSPERLQRLAEDLIEGTDAAWGLPEKEGNIPPLDMEQALLFTTLLADFMILVRPLTGTERDFLVYWIRKFEVANIKAILRGKMADMPVGEIRSSLTDIRPFSALPVGDLLRTEDTAEMLRRLEADGPYGTVARHAREVYEKKRELFTLEATIDHRYLSGVMHKAQAVKAEERDALVRIAGFVVDRYNLIWLLRYRFIYGLSPGETFYLLVPFGPRRLIGTDLAELARSNSITEALTKLPIPLQEKLANARSITDIEQIVEEIVRQAARAALKQSGNALARAFSYLILRECEINRTAAVLKGRKFRFAPHIIRDGAGLRN